MKLHDRQLEILQLLMKEQRYLTMHSIAEQCRVSYKTIANDMKLLDEWLQEKEIYLERTPNKGILLQLTQEQMELLNQMLHRYCQHESSTSLQERRERILLTYVWNPTKYHSIQKFSTQYFVSNSSILKDMELVQERLVHYGLSLEKSNKGTRIVGSELNMRKALLDDMERYLEEHASDAMRYDTLNALLHDLIEGYSFELDEIMGYLQSCMKDLETVSRKVINEPYYTNAFLYMSIMVLRISMGFCIQDKQELVYPEDEIEAIDFDFTKQLAGKLEEHYHITIQEAEAINIYRHLISGGLSKKEIAIVEQKTKENNRLSLTLAYTRYLIEQMSALSGIDFSNQVYLHSNLRFHVKPMLNRLRYEIGINNMILSEIKKRYPLEFACTKISCCLTSRRYELPEPSDAEVAYVMVYFQSAMERNLHDIHALIVTSNSMGSAQLLKTRLENTFQDLYVKDMISPAKLNDVNMENIDVIFSTGEVKINLPYVGISPFLDEADVVTIRHTIKQLKKQSIVEKKTKEVSIENGVISMDTNALCIALSKHLWISIKQGTQHRVIFEQRDHLSCYEIQYQKLQEITPCLQVLLHSALPIKS